MLRRSAGTPSLIVRISHGNNSRGCFFRSLSSSSVVVDRQYGSRRLLSSFDKSHPTMGRHDISISAAVDGMRGHLNHRRFIATSSSSSLIRSPAVNNRNASCEINSCRRGMIVPSSALFDSTRMGGSKLWMSSSSSSSGNNSTGTNDSNTTPPSSSPGDKTTPLSFENNSSSTTTHSSSSSSSPSSNSNNSSSSSSGKVDDTLREVGQRWTKIKQVWAPSDFVAVWSTLFLFFCILVGPNVVKNMRDDSPHPYDDIVDDEITTLTRQLLQTATDFNSSSSSENNNPLIESLSDLLSRISSTPTLRQSLSELTSSVLTSPEVTEACRVLIKKLFHDLINDEDTLREVVALIQLVLRDPNVKKSVTSLITELTRDDDLLQTLSRLVDRLTREETVQKATRELLTQSTHKTLSDWEVLEHGMEFAADVVGDDVVQRTSGEALWNTISYSVRPGFATLLSFVGISFLGVSLYLFRRPTTSSSSPLPPADHLAKTMASIGRDVHGNALYGVSSLWAIPFRTAETIVIAIGTVIALPKRMVMMGVNGGRRVVEGVTELMDGVRRGVWYVIIGDSSTRTDADGSTMTIITHRLSTLTRSVHHYLINTITLHLTILNQHVIKCLQSTQKRIDDQLNQIARRTIDNLNSSKMGRRLQSCRETFERWKASLIRWGEEWREGVRSWWETIQRHKRRVVGWGERLRSAGVKRWNDIWDLWHGVLLYLRQMAVQSQRLCELLQRRIIEMGQAMTRMGGEKVAASERLYWEMLTIFKKDWVRLMTRSREGVEDVRKLVEEWRVLMVLWCEQFFKRREDMT